MEFRQLDHIKSKKKMANKPSKIVEEADQGHFFFIGGRSKLLQWSISQKKVTKEYGDIMNDSIYSMV
jgi:hypothetical protein